MLDVCFVNLFQIIIVGSSNFFLYSTSLFHIWFVRKAFLFANSLLIVVLLDFHDPTCFILLDVTMICAVLQLLVLVFCVMLFGYCSVQCVYCSICSTL
jgi:hypothetical protein